MQPILDSLKFDANIFLFQLVTLIVLLVVMNAIFWKPYLAHLKARDQHITDAHDQRDRLQREMESLRNEYLERITQVEAEARARIQSAVKEAQEERERILKETREQSDAAIKQGVAAMQRDKEESLVTLRDRMIALAVDAASKALGASADPSALRLSVEKQISSAAQN